MQREKILKYKILVLLNIAAICLVLPSAALATTSDHSDPSLMPPNEVKIVQSLREHGVISSDTTETEALDIYQQYIKRKLGKGEERGNSVAAMHLKKGETSGSPNNKHIRPVRPNNKRFDNVLTLLVEFNGTDNGYIGPLHNEIQPPSPDDNTKLWVEDFNPDHYKTMLFDMSPGARSMSNFYLEQSGQTYTVDGQVNGWVAVDHSEWWYGADGPSGNDNLNGPVWRVVRDAVSNSCNIPWAQFDKEDPYDIDGDGNYAEPDGYIDHIQFVHAGEGQEGGGGAQGDDAIWSHSWWANSGSHGPGYGGVPTCDPNVWVGPYTINPEDGTIGVFAHEFGHDLGLPDLYDTIYSGEASTGFWTLMSSGSWLGCQGEALGTCPANMGVWEKWVLGWLDPVVVNKGEIKKNILLKSAETPGPANKAIRVLLPPYSYLFEVNEPHSGKYEWYSGKGDNLNNVLTREFSLPENAKLTFWTWYDIELDWDYGFVEVSTDGGTTWATVQGSITTNFDPNGNNQEGNGITGSNGWVHASFDLSAFGGQTVLLRFRYETDMAVQGLGWTIDDISINGFSDDVEIGNQGWNTNSWKIFEGTANIETFHYYMAEWRTPRGFDASMTNWYNALDDNTVETFSASPGMLLWYRNGRYNDNWVGEHPWAGGWQVVDSHPDLILANDTKWLANLLFDPDPNLDLPFRTRIQLADATFGIKPTQEQPIRSWFGLPTESNIHALPGVPTFDDSINYVDNRWEPWFYSNSDSWLIRNSISSVDTPTYGLKITVKDEIPNAGMINVDFR